jgi:septal ring factor EnvC (AmiA/AmiB activator)
MFDNLSPNMKAAIFTAFIGAIGGGGTWIYNIGYSNGARDISAVEAFKGKLPTMIDDLDKVAKSLAQTTELIDQNKKLTKEAADATSAKRQIEETTKKQAKDLEEKDKRIADLSTLVAKAFPANEIKVSIAQGARRLRC